MKNSSFNFKLKSKLSLVDMELSNRVTKVKRMSLAMGNGVGDMRASVLVQLSAKKKEKKESLMRNLILGGQEGGKDED